MEHAFNVALKQRIKGFITTLIKKWSSAGRNLKTFQLKNKIWLSLNFNIFGEIETRESVQQPSTSTGRGRPKKLFSESCERTKRRKTKNLATGSTTPELSYATCTRLHMSGKRTAANIIKGAIASSPNTIRRVKNSYKTEKKIEKYTAEESLAILIDNKMSVKQYKNIRLAAKEKKANIFAPYDHVLNAKKNCYPKNIHITETSCEVPLQDLLDHTVIRILKISNINIPVNIFDNIELICKWGCDGSSGHSQYKQKFSESSTTTDYDLFMFSMVPLQLRFTDECGDKHIIWKNPRYSSTRFCRPIKFEFKKESVISTQEEVEAVKSEILNLHPTIYMHGTQEIKIKHTMIFSMIDGKVANSVTKTSSQTCFICGCTPIHMNRLENMDKFSVDPETFSFGLSTLHAYIRFLECILHIAYRLEFKTWQVRSVENKVKFSERKSMIQNRFRTETGLLIDVVLEGKGTSNDGNTARRFFKNCDKSANITGVDKNLIQRFGNILFAMSSGHEVNVPEFKMYTADTAKLFISLYPWYNMPSSVHKILIHGADVINAALLPIGQLSEEAAEANNKEYKKFREHHTRKNTRYNTNEDLIHMLLVASDPYLSSIRKLPKKPIRELTDDVMSLLILPDTEIEEENYEPSDDDDENDGEDGLEEDSVSSSDTDL
ncbi:uncharacterized protein LOC126899604 [Daktulosphaira vitifoliae]|nr:uncharacterized protein LOC126899604 [Daktulosphaira vitifoliae]